MAICVALQADGTLVPTGQPVEACTGYVLVSASEHASYSVLSQVFAMPPVEQAMASFSAVFGFVLLMNVAGHIAGSVVKAVSTERD